MKLIETHYFPKYLSLIVLFLLLSCQSEQDLDPVLAPAAEDTVTLMKSEGFKDMYGSWDLLGYLKGEKVSDFTLFSPHGQSFNLHEQLSQGKPLLLLTGSYTCDITRAKLPAIQDLYQQYGQQIDMYMIYTIEAHPIDQVSPYAKDNKIWVVLDNVRDSVEARQPLTYGERVALALHWQNRYTIQLPILMDSPDNLFWKKFGQAPNMAYLIQPNGAVFFKQTWFEETKMEQQLLSLLQSS